MTIQTVFKDCDNCAGSGFSVFAQDSCEHCNGTGGFTVVDTEGLSEEQLHLASVGLPADFLDRCTWCNGSGDDGGGYSACPDCESTGYKHGKKAEGYIELEMDKAYELHQTILQVLADHHGFVRKELIPKQVETFVCEYLSHLFCDEYFEDHEKVKDYMMDEFPPGTVTPHSICGYWIPGDYIGLGYDDTVLPSREFHTFNWDYYSSLQVIFDKKETAMLMDVFQDIPALSEEVMVPIKFEVTWSEISELPPSIKTIEIHNLIF